MPELKLQTQKFNSKYKMQKNYSLVWIAEIFLRYIRDMKVLNLFEQAKGQGVHKPWNPCKICERVEGILLFLLIFYLHNSEIETDNCHTYSGMI